LECSWSDLSNFISKRDGDLDTLIAAHNKYLNHITSRGLLASSGSQSLLTKLLRIFDSILSFKLIMDRLYSSYDEEFKKQQDWQGKVYKRTKAVSGQLLFFLH